MIPINFNLNQANPYINLIANLLYYSFIKDHFIPLFHFLIFNHIL